MKEAVRYLILSFAILVVIAMLVMWKKQDRAQAFVELKERYEADISVTDEDFFVGCSSERLIDLVDFAELLARAGEPTILDLTGAPKLESLSGVEKLLKVHSLIAIACPNLKSAEGVARHPALRELVFTDSSLLADASAVHSLPALETLDFSGCEALTNFEISKLPQLKNLYLSRCREISTLNVTAAPGLKQLYLDGCSGLEILEGLTNLSALTDLDVSNASSLEKLSGVENLSSLIVLDIRNIAISDFSGIGQLPVLRVLRMGGNESIETLEPFSEMTALREIHLEACPNLASLEGMPSGISQYAGFTYCPKLTGLKGIEAAPGLEQLDLTGCESLKDVSALESLSSLVQLSLVKCRQVSEVSVIESMEKLVIVMLGGSGVVPASVEKLNAVNDEIIFDFTVSG
ncbi:MAG: hypothetical protein P1U68_16230 [Verrucomicrobiales bacterium]|nr:hypothetical protein [Verrucomicrobiales bacterium]